VSTELPQAMHQLVSSVSHGLSLSMILITIGTAAEKSS
jgi:hypothetical protein